MIINNQTKERKSLYLSATTRSDRYLVFELNEYVLPVQAVNSFEYLLRVHPGMWRSGTLQLRERSTDFFRKQVFSRGCPLTEFYENRSKKLDTYNHDMVNTCKTTLLLIIHDEPIITFPQNRGKYVSMRETRN